MLNPFSLGDIIFDLNLTPHIVDPVQKYYRSLIPRLDGMDLANKPSHATVSLKVPKHEIFILVDSQKKFTIQTLWDSDLGNSNKKII
jgi:hypothetical protein